MHNLTPMLVKYEENGVEKYITVDIDFVDGKNYVDGKLLSEINFDLDNDICKIVDEKKKSLRMSENIQKIVDRNLNARKV